MASAPPASSPGTSESTTRPLVVAAAVFLAVTAGSFFYLRNSDSRPHGSEKPVALSSGASRDETKSQTEMQREHLLENVGSVSSIYLYQAYLNIGLLADAVKNDTYTKDEAVELMGTSMTLLKTVDFQMLKLENVGLDDEEVAAVKQVRKISAQLMSQADYLQAHWKSGEKSSLDQFNQIRRESWTELRSILGIAVQG